MTNKVEYNNFTSTVTERVLTGLRSLRWNCCRQICRLHCNWVPTAVDSSLSADFCELFLYSVYWYFIYWNYSCVPVKCTCPAYTNWRFSYFLEMQWQICYYDHLHITYIQVSFCFWQL